MAVSGSHPIVLIARRIPAVGAERIAERCELREGGLGATPERIGQLSRGVEAIVADPTVAVGPELLDAAGPGLSVVANFAVGYDNIDLAACRARGVIATNTPDVLTDATAELALALTLAAARGLPTAERRLRDGEWTGFDTTGDLGIQLSGATFGVVGLGRIGRRYAELVRPIAGAILYTARSPQPEAEAALGAKRADPERLLADSDVVSIHAAATAETTGLVGSRELALMRPGAILVNTARGSLVDSAALAAALTEGRIAAAGLDVYEDEPTVPAELLAAPNCVLLPHIGSATVTARDGMAGLVADSVLAVLDGREPPNRIV
ncbi:MAG TPA: D-glycerate dehydrogenase [Solirubrobacterales bacterium]